MRKKKHLSIMRWLSAPTPSGMTAETSVPVAKFQEVFSRLCQHHGLLFVTGMIAALACYGFSAMTVTLDQEGFGSIASRMETVAENYSGVGRYLLYFISRYITSGTFTPWLTLMIASGLLSISAVFFVRVFLEKTTTAGILAVAVFVATPFFSSALHLWLWSVAFGIAYLTATAAAYLTLRRGAVWGPSILMIATLLNYQPALGFYLVTLGCYAIFTLSQRPWREGLDILLPVAARAAVALIAGLVSYLTVLQFFGAGNSYTDRQTSFIASPLGIIENIGAALAKIVSLPIERGDFHELFPFVLLGLVIVALIQVAIGVVSKNENPIAKGLTIAVVALAVVLTPVAITPFNIVLEQPVWFGRTMVSSAAVFAFLVLIAVSSRHAIISVIGLVLSVVTVWWFAQANNVNSFGQYAMNQYDMITASRMVDRITALEEYNPDIAYQIIAVEPSWRHRSPAPGAADFRPVITYAFVGDFGWYIGNMFSMAGLRNVSAGSNVAPIIERHAEIIDTMEAWPKDGSIVIVEDRYIFVKYH